MDFQEDLLPEVLSDYDGSQIFRSFAKRVGLSVDLVNFLFCQVSALFLASLFRSVLHPSKCSVTLRHSFALVVGLALGYFCFGVQAIHIAGLPALCYIIIRTQNPMIVQRMVMVVALVYLSCLHLNRQFFSVGIDSVDITCPLMIITQKVISVAFQVHDGFRATDAKAVLTTSQRKHAIVKVPTALEFFSYTLHFQGLMAGPMVFYRDYIDCIDGSQYLKQSRTSSADGVQIAKEILLEPSPIVPVVKKVIASFVCAGMFMYLADVYPISGIASDDLLNGSTAAYQLWYVMMATTVVRFKYYHAWLFADAICNNSGIGFNGYDERGKSKWDLISNINVINFEFGTNFRECINNWNMGTNRWLRQVVFERVPKKYGTILTFATSAIWHGFYPGYYITFATGALFTTAARVARSRLRHRFQVNAVLRDIYDVLTCLVTRVFMAYATFPFVFLELGATARLYLKLYMCLHVVAAATLVGLPRVLSGDRKASSLARSMAKGSCDKTRGGGISTEESSTTNINLVREKLISLDTVSENLLEDLKTQLEQLDAKNIEQFIEKTKTGIVELKDDLMKEGQLIYEAEPWTTTSLKDDISSLNVAVQQSHVLPAVFSNGNAK